jgi:hypothetical protein
MRSATRAHFIRRSIGNMDMRSCHEAIGKCGTEVLETSLTHRLVIVYADRIESVE